MKQRCAPTDTEGDGRRCCIPAAAGNGMGLSERPASIRRAHTHYWWWKLAQVFSKIHSLVLKLALSLTKCVSEVSNGCLSLKSGIPKKKPQIGLAWYASVANDVDRK
jgi:hypothetical protein